MEQHLYVKQRGSTWCGSANDAVTNIIFHQVGSWGAGEGAETPAGVRAAASTPQMRLNGASLLGLAQCSA